MRTIAVPAGRILLALPLLVLLVAVPAHAQITVDATASASATFSSTLSWSHTVGSGNNRLLVVGLAINAALQATSVTYGGQPLTLQVHNGGGPLLTRSGLSSHHPAAPRRSWSPIR